MRSATHLKIAVQGVAHHHATIRTMLLRARLPGAWMKIYGGWCPSGNGPAIHPSRSSCKIKILQDLKRWPIVCAYGFGQVTHVFWSQSVDPHATKETGGVYQPRSEGVAPRVSRVWTLGIEFSRIILHCNQQKRSWNVPSLVLYGRWLVLRERYMRKVMAHLKELSAAMSSVVAPRAALELTHSPHSIANTFNLF